MARVATGALLLLGGAAAVSTHRASASALKTMEAYQHFLKMKVRAGRAAAVRGL
jgi:hypothetical protein